MTGTELLAAARPILFNTEMVRAIMDGRKTVTRRVVKFPVNKLTYELPSWNNVYPDSKLCYSGKHVFHIEPHFFHIMKLPYKLGDILYVRETWAPVIDYTADGQLIQTYAYKSDNEKRFHGITMSIPITGWHPSIHMPKEAARIFLRVTSVRVERLQDMIPDDFKREGVKECGGCCHFHDFCGGMVHLAADCKLDSTMNYSATFAELWDSTVNKKDLALYGWDANPWVWVIEFERLEVQE